MFAGSLGGGGLVVIDGGYNSWLPLMQNSVHAYALDKGFCSFAHSPWLPEPCDNGKGVRPLCRVRPLITAMLGAYTDGDATVVGVAKRQCKCPTPFKVKPHCYKAAPFRVLIVQVQ